MVARGNTHNTLVSQALERTDSSLRSGRLDVDAERAALGNGRQHIAWGLPIPIPGMPISPGDVIPGILQNALQKDKGPYSQQAAMLDQLLTTGGRPRGNIEPLSIGKNETGNAFTLARTDRGVKISVRTEKGATYDAEVAGAGAIKSASYVSEDGKTQPVSEATIDNMIRTALVLGQKAIIAPEL